MGVAFADRLHRTLLVYAVAAGCSAGSQAPPERPPPAPAEACTPGAPTRIRRLATVELEATVRHLLGPEALLVHALPPDPRAHGFDTAAETLTVSAGNFDEYQRAAERMAAALPVEALAPCPTASSPGACASDFARGFARRAFGRPLMESETQALLRVFETGAALDGYAGGIRLVAEAILSSPHFLYRTEIGDGSTEPDGRLRLGPFEIASALSFFLTASRPDEELLRAAEAGRLADPAERAAQARRLLARPEARHQLRRFVRDWLGLSDFEAVTKLWTLYGEFTPELQADMQRELDAYLDHALGDGGGTLRALMGGSESFVTPRLASVIYGRDVLAPVSSPGRVRLDPARRRGVISLPAFLARYATLDRTSPVFRGLAVRNALLCTDIPSPPPGVVPAIDGSDAKRTTREKAERHTSPACNGCHHLIDPIGFGFEQMDAIGRFRETENGLPVDSTSELTGTDVDGPFTGPAALADKLSASAKFRDCFALQLFRFGEGRDENDGDACELDELRAAFGASGGRIEDLAVALVARPGFVLRRASEGGAP